MVRRFFASNDAFHGEFAQFLEQERGTGDDVATIVTGILNILPGSMACSWTPRRSHLTM